MLYTFFIKYFFIIWSSIYSYIKIINKKISIKDIFIIFPYIILATLITCKLRQYIVSLNIIVIYLSILLFGFLRYKKEITKYSLISLFSFGIGAVSYVLSVLMSLPISVLLYNSIETVNNRTYIALLITGIIQFICLFFFFRVKRFKNLFAIINNRFTNDTGIFISFLILTATSQLYYTDNNLNLISLAILCVLFGIFGFIMIKKHILENYLNSIHKRNVDILENTLSEQDKLICRLTTENERLSTIIHRDNKIIPAMEYAVEEILTCQSSEKQKEKSALLLSQLKSLSAERSGIITEYENSNKQLPRTGIASLDASIKYLFIKAINKGVVLDLSVINAFNSLLNNPVSETDINTLILDLGENALYAASNVNTGCILIVLGTENNYFFVSVYDNGDRFDSDVIKNMGSKRITTHKDHGGTGIGLMTTFNILKKYKASFILDETIKNVKFTKKVEICFDECGRKDINVDSSV